MPFFLVCHSIQQVKIKSLFSSQLQPQNAPQFSSKSLLHCNYIIHTTGIQDFTKNFFSPRNRCLKRSYKGIYKTFNLFIYLDNGQWTHGGCRSAPMFFRSKNSHVFSPPAPTKFPNNKTVGYSPTPNKRKALDLASEKQLDNCIRFFPSS